MKHEIDKSKTLADDERTLQEMGYSQELARRMSGFSNFAISLSIICILAGGITSFQVGFCTVGGASIGLGWPLVCLFSLVVALAMGQADSPRAVWKAANGAQHQLQRRLRNLYCGYGWMELAEVMVLEATASLAGNAPIEATLELRTSDGERAEFRSSRGSPKDVT
jgi:hypothetical protein